MYLEGGGAGGSFTAGSGHPAGVLAGVSGGTAGQLQAEQVVLGGELQPVGELVVEGLVILEPGGGDASSSAGDRLECGLLSS